MKELEQGDRVKIVRAIISSTEPFLGKEGVVIRPGRKFKESQYLVAIDGMFNKLWFSKQELQKVD